MEKFKLLVDEFCKQNNITLKINGPPQIKWTKFPKRKEMIMFPILLVRGKKKLKIKYYIDISEKYRVPSIYDVFEYIVNLDPGTYSDFLMQFTLKDTAENSKHYNKMLRLFDDAILLVSDIYEKLYNCYLTEKYYNHENFKEIYF